MVKRVHFYPDHDFPGEGVYSVFCPGCKCDHPFRVGKSRNLPNWSFNGDMEKPTFSPSMLVNKDRPGGRCHSYVENGAIRFLSDCFHDLKGMTVELPEMDDDGDPVLNLQKGEG